MISQRIRTRSGERRGALVAVALAMVLGAVACGGGERSGGPASERTPERAPSPTPVEVADYLPSCPGQCDSSGVTPTER